MKNKSLEILKEINSNFELWDLLPSDLQERIYNLIKKNNITRNKL